MADILIVDDEPDILGLFTVILVGAGHAVTTANGGVPALGVLDSGQPLDLMVTDIMMPGLNGYNLAQMAKLRRPSVKILYMSGYHETADVMCKLGDRLGKLLSKPLRPSELVQEVSTALASHRPSPAAL